MVVVVIISITILGYIRVTIAPSSKDLCMTKSLDTVLTIGAVFTAVFYPHRYGCT